MSTSRPSKSRWEQSTRRDSVRRCPRWGRSQRWTPVFITSRRLSTPPRSYPRGLPASVRLTGKTSSWEMKKTEKDIFRCNYSMETSQKALNEAVKPAISHLVFILTITVLLSNCLTVDSQSVYLPMFCIWMSWRRPPACLSHINPELGCSVVTGLHSLEWDKWSGPAGRDWSPVQSLILP